MNIDITAKKFQLTDHLRDYVNEKVENLQRFRENITEVRVILEVDDGHHRHGRINGCEIIVHVGGIKEGLAASDRQEDIHTAINNAVNAMEREIKKHRDKHFRIKQDELRKLKEGGIEQP